MTLKNDEKTKVITQILKRVDDVPLIKAETNYSGEKAIRINVKIPPSSRRSTLGKRT